MNIIQVFKEKYRSSSKLFLALKIILGASTMYFAMRVIYISISGLVSPNASQAYPETLLFGMLFSLGLSNAVLVFEKLVTGKKEHVILLFVTALIVLGVSVYVLLV